MGAGRQCESQQAAREWALVRTGNNEKSRNRLAVMSLQPSLEIWREALAHLRHLSDDVWKGFTLFLALNGFVLMLLVARFSVGLWSAGKFAQIVVLCGIGFTLTLAGHYLLKRHRVYYLQMLAKKSLIEMDLGMYDTKLKDSRTDLAFPWRLTPEVVGQIQKDFDGWVKKSIRAKGTIARVQFWFYEALLGIYAATLVATVVMSVE
jgi:hypothetical protein